MKVIQSIDVVFESQRLLNDRLKKAESFALKLETGRFSESSKLEDFFACTVVVDNLDQIKKAQELVKKNFVINAQRPKDLKFTHKDPSSFQFDDLRLYVTLKH